MQAFVDKFKALNKKQKINLLMICILALLMVAFVCEAIGASTAKREITDIREELGAQLYSDMYMLMQTFDMTNVPSADIENSVLPAMYDYYASAKTINEAMTECFGSRYTVLTGDDEMTLEAAFDAYNEAFDRDTATDQAKVDMGSAIELVRKRIETRFVDGVVKKSR